MFTEHNHDDTWLAVQYALGELSAEAAAAFELRLADDPGLCQHLADAGRLVATLQSAQPAAPVMPLVPRLVASHSAAPKLSRPWAGAAAIAAAAVCLALVILPQVQPASQLDTARADRAATVKLVSLWRWQGEALRTADGDRDVCDDDHEWTSDQVPSWMIAAVSLERRQRNADASGPAAPGQDDEEWEDN